MTHFLDLKHTESETTNTPHTHTHHNKAEWSCMNFGSNLGTK